METFRFHLLSGRRPATWRPGASALPPDRRTRLGWRPAAVAAVPPPGEGLRWPPRETRLSLRPSSCCPTVHSRAGCRFICSAVRKPSSLGAKNPKPPVITCRLARRTTSDDRPQPLRAAKRETDDGTRRAWSTDATPGRAIGQGLEGGETRRRTRGERDHPQPVGERPAAADARAPAAALRGPGQGPGRARVPGGHTRRGNPPGVHASGHGPGRHRHHGGRPRHWRSG
jgi:hypothetical protein